MTVLRSGISAHTTVVTVDAPLSNPSYPLFYDLDSETIKVVDGADTTEWQVERGVADTQQARHAKSVQLVANANPYGGGGGGVSGDNGVDPPTAVATLVAPGATVDGDVMTLLPGVSVGTNGEQTLILTNPNPLGNSQDHANAFIINRTDEDTEEVQETVRVSVSGDTDWGLYPGAYWQIRVLPHGFNMRIGDGEFRVFNSIAVNPFTERILDIFGVGQIWLYDLPTSDPFSAGQLYTDGVPSAGVPKPLMVSGG